MAKGGTGCCICDEECAGSRVVAVKLHFAAMRASAQPLNILKYSPGFSPRESRSIVMHLDRSHSHDSEQKHLALRT